jgi:hypothetical protein
MRRVFRKKGGTFRPHVSKDDRDKLLFDITEITPPPRKLGTFRLEPSAACGDLISARVRVEGESEKVEQPFIIKKVSWKYEYLQGSYRMVARPRSSSTACSPRSPRQTTPKKKRSIARRAGSAR